MRSSQSPALLTLGRAARKLFLSAFVILTFLIYAVHERLAGPGPVSASGLAGAPQASPTAPAPMAALLSPTLAPLNTDQSTNPQPTVSQLSTVQPTQMVYVIQPGDSLDGIAQQFGVTVDAILAVNGISDPNVLRIGQTIIIPASGSVPATAAPINQDPLPTQPAAVQPTAVPTNPPTAGQYKNGQYTGPRVDAYYGFVQVQALVQNGQIANVKFLEFPNDRRTSQQINAIAVPYLTNEAIQAQSANVDIISGATLTSEAFAQSLQTALQNAAP
jgi:uncharacterized protein with FMN-binding domain